MLFRSWHSSGMGDTQSGVMPCPKIPVPCSHFLDCPNCWKGCDSVASFSDAKLTLFRKEIWEEGQSLVRRGLGMAGWGSCLGGFMVLTAALVSFLATRLGSLPLSCLIIGAAYFVIGAGWRSCWQRR